MNYLDLLAFIVITVSILSAVAKGLSTELVSLACAMIGLLLAILLYPSMASILSRFGVQPGVSDFLGFVILFLLTVIAGILSGTHIGRFKVFFCSKKSERWLSAFLGLLRGYLINTTLVLAFVAFSINLSLLKDSLTSPIYIVGARAVSALSPAYFQASFDKGYQLLLSTEFQSKPD